MSLRMVTPPALEPVSLAELKAFARVDHAEDDALIEGLGRAAREFVEAFTGAALMTQTWEFKAREWPCAVILLAKPPLQGVVSVKHRDPIGALATLTENADFIVDAAGGAVEPVTAWPRVGDYPDAVQIRFTAGYPSVAEVPQTAKTAISALVAHWYDTPHPVESSADGATRRVPFHVKALLAQLRGGRLEMTS